MARTWTCRKCKTSGIPKIKHLCPECGKRRPATKKPQHQMVLEVPYETWVKVYGEQCGICGRPPSEGRRLDRDHDHKTGEPRGLLCHLCNRWLPEFAGVEWHRKAIRYLKGEGNDRPVDGAAHDSTDGSERYPQQEGCGQEADREGPAEPGPDPSQPARPLDD